jgi:hypothetical protein
MQTSFTSKLFFKKFQYKIRIEIEQDFYISSDKKYEDPLYLIPVRSDLNTGSVSIFKKWVEDKTSKHHFRVTVPSEQAWAWNQIYYHEIDDKFYRVYNEAGGRVYAFPVHIPTTLRKSKDPATYKVNLDVYLNDESVFNELITHAGKAVIHVVRPFNQAHLEKMTAETHIVFKEKLLFGKYRHSIKFELSQRDEAAEIKRELSDVLGENIDERYLIKDWWSSIVVYISEPSDLMMVKLSLGDMITEMTEVSTLSELKSK